MLLAQHSVLGPGLWSPGLLALWLVALSAQSGEDRFGGRRIARTHAGSIIPSTGIAGITPVDGIITKPLLLSSGLRVSLGESPDKLFTRDKRGGLRPMWQICRCKKRRPRLEVGAEVLPKLIGRS